MRVPADRKAAIPIPTLLAAAIIACLPAGCMTEQYPDRDPLVVENAPVDSLAFLPPGARYVLEDSLSAILFQGYRPGYACTEVTALDLSRRAGLNPPGFSARLDLRLPARPTCAITDSARDTVAEFRFTAADGPVVRLLDSSGTVLDTALLVEGALSADTLVHVGPALTASEGRFTYRDSSGTLGRLLFADSLGACEFLNHAEFSEQRDTTTIRFTWVTLDPSAAPDSCMGPSRQDTITPIPARP
jgi:hypothetical protein